MCLICASKDKARMDKIKKTNLIRYGCENAMQNSLIQQRQMDSFLIKGGEIPSSIPERKMIEMICNLGYKCITGLQIGKYFPDGILYYQNLKIDVEYDGLHWHKDSFKDETRDLYFLEHGYKVFRVKAHRGIPNIERISFALQQLIDNDRYYYELYI